MQTGTGQADCQIGRFQPCVAMCRERQPVVGKLDHDNAISAEIPDDEIDEGSQLRGE